MNDIQVPEANVAHELCPALMAKQENPRTVTPESAILDRDALDIAVRGSELQAFEGDAVVIAADEAVGNKDVLRVAGVDAVIVLYS